jgi:hypothetical protein
MGKFAIGVTNETMGVRRKSNPLGTKKLGIENFSKLG